MAKKTQRRATREEILQQITEAVTFFLRALAAGERNDTQTQIICNSLITNLVSTNERGTIFANAVAQSGIQMVAGISSAEQALEAIYLLYLGSMAYACEHVDRPSVHVGVIAMLGALIAKP